MSRKSSRGPQHKPIHQPLINLLKRKTPAGEDLRLYFDSPVERRMDATRLEFLVEFIRLGKAMARTNSAHAPREEMDRIRDSLLRASILYQELNPGSDETALIRAIQGEKDPWQMIERVRGNLHVSNARGGFEIGNILSEHRLADTPARTVSLLASDTGFTRPSYLVTNSDAQFQGIVLLATGKLRIADMAMKDAHAPENPDVTYLCRRNNCPASELQGVLYQPEAEFDASRFEAVAERISRGERPLLVFSRLNHRVCRRQGLGWDIENIDNWIMRVPHDLIRTAAVHEATHAMDKKDGRRLNEKTAIYSSMAYGEPLGALVQSISACMPRRLVRDRIADGNDEMFSLYKLIESRYGLAGFASITAEQVREVALELFDGFCRSRYGRPHEELYDVNELRRIARLDFIAPEHLLLLQTVNSAVMELFEDKGI